LEERNRVGIELEERKYKGKKVRLFKT